MEVHAHLHGLSTFPGRCLSLGRRRPYEDRPVAVSRLTQEPSGVLSRGSAMISLETPVSLAARDTGWSSVRAG
jgi:hypothetical protein